MCWSAIRWAAIWFCARWLKVGSDPDAAVLVAPMVDFIRHGIPAVLMHAAARVMAAIGDARRPAWKWGEKPAVLPVDRINLLTHDEHAMPTRSGGATSGRDCHGAG